MFQLVRREFLELSCRTLGALAFGNLRGFPFAPQSPPNPTPAKIYAVFFDIAPSRDDLRAGRKLGLARGMDVRYDARASRLDGVAKAEARQCEDVHGG